jgi:hypothetical protein
MFHNGFKKRPNGKKDQNTKNKDQMRRRTKYQKTRTKWGNGSSVFDPCHLEFALRSWPLEFGF